MQWNIIRSIWSRSFVQVMTSTRKAALESIFRFRRENASSTGYMSHRRCALNKWEKAKMVLFLSPSHECTSKCSYVRCVTAAPSCGVTHSSFSLSMVHTFLLSWHNCCSFLSLSLHFFLPLHVRGCQSSWHESHVWHKQWLVHLASSVGLSFVSVTRARWRVQEGTQVHKCSSKQKHSVITQKLNILCESLQLYWYSGCYLCLFLVCSCASRATRKIKGKRLKVHLESQCWRMWCNKKASEVKESGDANEHWYL